MRIDNNLNLIIPVYNDDGDKTSKPSRAPTLRAMVHSTPISDEVFDTYFEPIAQVFTEIHAGRYTAISGPKVAAKLLRKTCMASQTWESDPRTGRIGVKDGLVEEIHRLTNVLTPGENGWKDLMYQEAKNAVLSKREAEEVDSMLIFFTVSWHMYPLHEVKEMLEGAMSLRGARVESLPFTELRASMPKSTAAGNSGGTAAAS